MRKALPWLLGIILISILSFSSIKQVKAVSTIISSSQTNILDSDEYLTNATISANVANGTTYYLRGEFFKPGTSSYCGFTWNGSSWFNGPFTSNGWLNLMPITIQSNSWSGQVKAKFDSDSSVCNQAGTYSFRILRYTAGGSTSTDGQTPLSVNVTFETPNPTDTPSATNTPIPTATPTPTPSETATPTASPTATEVPTATPSPTDIPTSTPLDTPTPTAVPTQSPTPIPTPTPVSTESPKPTVTPTPKENDNDHDDEHHSNFHFPKLTCTIKYEKKHFGRFLIYIPHVFCRFE